MNDASKIRSFEDLQVWKMGIVISRDVSQLTASIPDSENYGLISQMRRAAVSIPTNIADGWGRGRSRQLKFCPDSTRVASGTQNPDYDLPGARNLRPNAARRGDGLFGGCARRVLHAYIESIQDSVVKEEALYYSSHVTSVQELIQYV